ncbi:hypothetical protein Vretifemale_15201, partial [Volvox reticuliferus]
ITTMEDSNCPTWNSSVLALNGNNRPKGSKCPVDTSTPQPAVNYADVSQPTSAGNASTIITNPLPCLLLDVDALLGRYVGAWYLSTAAAPVEAPATVPAALIKATEAANVRSGRSQVTPVNVSSSDSLKLGGGLSNAGNARWGRNLVDEDSENDAGTYNGSSSGVRGYANPAPAETVSRRQTLSGFDPAAADAMKSAELFLTAAEAKSHTINTTAAALPRQCTAERTGQNGARVPKCSKPDVTIRPGARRFLSTVTPYFALYAFSSSAENGNVDGSGKCGDEWLDQALGMIDPMQNFLIRRPQWPSATRTHGSGLQGSQRCQERSLAQLGLALSGVGSASADTVIVTCARRDFYGALSDNVIQVVPYDSSSGQDDDILDHVATILVRHLVCCEEANSSTCCYLETLNHPGPKLETRSKSAYGKVRHVLEELGLWPDPLAPSGVATAMRLKQVPLLAVTSSTTASMCSSSNGKRRSSNEGSFGSGSVGSTTGTVAAAAAAAASASSGRWRRAKGWRRSHPEARAWLSAIPEDWDGEDHQTDERELQEPPQQQQQQQQQQRRPARVPPSPTGAFGPSRKPMSLRQLVVMPQPQPLQLQLPSSSGKSHPSPSGANTLPFIPAAAGTAGAFAAKAGLLRSFSFHVKAALMLKSFRTLSDPAKAAQSGGDGGEDGSGGGGDGAVFYHNNSSCDGGGTGGGGVQAAKLDEVTAATAAEHYQPVLSSRLSTAVAKRFAAASARVRHYWRHLSPDERKDGVAGMLQPPTGIADQVWADPPSGDNEDCVAVEEGYLSWRLEQLPRHMQAVGAAAPTANGKGIASQRDFRLASDALILAGKLSELQDATPVTASIPPTGSGRCQGPQPQPHSSNLHHGSPVKDYLFHRALAAAHAVSYRPLREVIEEVVLRHVDPARGSLEEAMLWLLWEISEAAARQGTVICG